MRAVPNLHALASPHSPAPLRAVRRSHRMAGRALPGVRGTATRFCVRPRGRRVRGLRPAARRRVEGAWAQVARRGRGGRRRRRARAARRGCGRRRSGGSRPAAPARRRAGAAPRGAARAPLVTAAGRGPRAAACTAAAARSRPGGTASERPRDLRGDEASAASPRPRRRRLHERGDGGRGGVGAAEGWRARRPGRHLRACDSRPLRWVTIAPQTPSRSSGCNFR